MIEFFTEHGRGFCPKASIRKQGQIGLNQGAVKKHGISTWKCAILGYDKEKQMVALKLSNDEALPGATRIVIRQGNGTIAAKGFLDFFGIPYRDKTKKYDLKEDAETDCLVFFLEKKEHRQDALEDMETTSGRS